METNKFKEKFAPPLLHFWQGATDDERNTILTDVLTYANANPQSFKTDMRAIWFDEELAPLSVVMEALARDIDNWSDFYLEVLDAIFIAAKTSAKPQNILINLTEFAYVEEMEAPVVQKIADRLLKETTSDNAAIRKAAAIEVINYLFNNSISNKNAITAGLHCLLDDDNWRVRHVTWQMLAAEDLLPACRNLSLKDRLFALVWGNPLV